ncbi:MAG: DNA recombination/repair protein RecA [Acetobacter sp.]|nr:DNA recombination/repair protein RecA [Acetobacter sp.]
MAGKSASAGTPTLEDVLKDIEKASGKGALMDGVQVVDIPRVKVPAHQLNLSFTGGGCPRGRIIELYGAEGGGKSSTALIIAAGFQKEDERKIFYVDAEGTYDPFWAAKLGVDNDRVILWKPDASTAEEVFEQCLHVAESDGVSLIIIDSFPALVPQNVEEKDMTELTMAGISKPLSTFSQKMTKVLLKRPSITVIGLNQVRDNMSQYGDPLQTPGGHAWKHFCSIRLQVRSTPVDDAGKEQPDKSDTATGVRIWNFLKKNKTGPRDWKTVSFTVNFLTGFNPKLDLVETAVMLGLVEQKGANYQFTNTETGELVKGFGKRAFLEALTGENEQFLEDLVLSYSKPQRA